MSARRLSTRTVTQQQAASYFRKAREFTAAETAEMVKAVGRFWTWAQAFFL